MTRGKALADDLRAVIVNMGMTQDIANITRLTGVKRRTVERIFADYRNKGTVMRENMYKELRGRKHSLTVSDTKVRCLSLGCYLTWDPLVESFYVALCDIAQICIWLSFKRF
jgi:transcriptional regulator GlxA family with amidase domain